MITRLRINNAETSRATRSQSCLLFAEHPTSGSRPCLLVFHHLNIGVPAHIMCTVPSTTCKSRKRLGSACEWNQTDCWSTHYHRNNRLIAPLMSNAAPMLNTYFTTSGCFEGKVGGVVTTKTATGRGHFIHARFALRQRYQLIVQHHIIPDVIFTRSAGWMPLLYQLKRSMPSGTNFYKAFVNEPRHTFNQLW